MNERMNRNYRRQLCNQLEGAVPRKTPGTFRNPTPYFSPRNPEKFKLNFKLLDDKQVLAGFIKILSMLSKMNGVKDKTFPS